MYDADARTFVRLGSEGAHGAFQPAGQDADRAMERDVRPPPLASAQKDATASRVIMRCRDRETGLPTIVNQCPERDQA
jgi:hypothetical protein